MITSTVISIDAIALQVCHSSSKTNRDAETEECQIAPILCRFMRRNWGQDDDPDSLLDVAASLDRNLDEVVSLSVNAHEVVVCNYSVRISESGS